MRKKIFAILMSAMMMVTFMPAMAFAAPINLQGTTTIEGWTVSGLNGAAVHPGGDVASGDAYFVYDGQSHTVEYTPSKQTGVEKVVNFYAVKYTVDGKDTWTRNLTTAPVVKDAGKYHIYASLTRFANTFTGVNYDRYFCLEIKQRQVWMIANNTALAKTKVYDGKKYSVTDADFTFSPVMENGKAVDNTGLVAGDTIITKAMEYGPEVGTYVTLLNTLKTNDNYTVVRKFGFNSFALEITKATPTVKVTSNTLTIKAGKSKAVKFSANLGTAKLTKLSGNAKINLKNGKLYVKKGLKKGTYKIKVKAAVAESNNWFAASRTKTLTVKVK